MRYILFFISCLSMSNVFAGHPEGPAAILVDSAQESVYVTAAEVSPNWPLHDALVRAANRGIQVRVLLHAHRYNGAPELRTAGPSVYELEDPRLGAKAPDDFIVVIDGETLVRGQQVKRDPRQAARLIHQFKELVLQDRMFDWAMRH